MIGSFARPQILFVALLLTAPALAQPGMEIRAPGHPAGESRPPAAELPVGRFSLNQAIEAMRHSHVLLQAARASLRAAAAEVVGAGLWTNPIADASYGRSFTNPQNDPVGSVGIGVSQFLEIAGAPEARRSAAKLNEKAVISDAELIVRSLAFEVESACLALTAAAVKVQMYADSNAELDRANQIVSARVRAGAAPQYDASRIAVAVAQARAALADANADLAQARGDLDVAVGPDAEHLQGLPDIDLYEMATPSGLDALLAEAQQNRPDLVAAHDRARAAEAQVSVARRNVLPGFSLRGGVYFGTTPGEFGGTIGVGVPLPIIDHGQGAVSAALARSEVANAIADAMTLQATQRVRASYIETLRRRENFQQYQGTGVTLSHGMVQEAEAGYRAGKLSVLELVDAYVAKRDARLRAIELANDARQADVRLRRAVQAGAGSGL
jgi:cobalt-zinc-cadmium efflux system outer membrane protein